jgi:K+-transporting ATPase ATPase C chain
MKSLWRPALVLFAALTLLTGVIYPLAVTALCQAAFPHEANGSLIPATADEEAPHRNLRDWSGKEGKSPEAVAFRGSEWIGQPFSSESYFWSRPSATGPTAYNGAASTGSNLGPTNPAQLDAARSRVEAFRKSSDDELSLVPVDLVTASASGLDPHISPAAAEYQAPRIAQARGLGEYEVHRLISEHVEGRFLGVLGEPRVNVLKLNLALDELARSK